MLSGRNCLKMCAFIRYLSNVVSPQAGTASFSPQGEQLLIPLGLHCGQAIHYIYNQCYKSPVKSQGLPTDFAKNVKQVLLPLI